MAPPGYGNSTPSLGLPRPGPALRALLIVIGVLGLVNALLAEYTELAQPIYRWLACWPNLVLHGYVWQLLTAGVLTSPNELSHLLFTLVGLYFLSTDLERRWGSARFLRFILLSIVAGNVLATLADLVPLRAVVLHPVVGMVYGAGAAITATAVAWSRLNADRTVNLFFVFPVRGTTLMWITLGYCALAVIFPSHMMGSEGAIAPFGGFLVGLLLTGSPSPLRAFYLQTKLALLRKKTGGAHLASYGLSPSSTARKTARHGGPPLRVVYGGLDRDEGKRKPKNKDLLN